MKSKKEQQDEWHSDPNNWKWGIFYYNPDDPRLFPPKRFRKLGWTINFANPGSIFFFVIILLFVLVIGISSINH